MRGPAGVIDGRVLLKFGLLNSGNFSAEGGFCTAACDLVLQNINALVL